MQTGQNTQEKHLHVHRNTKSVQHGKHVVTSDRYFKNRIEILNELLLKHVHGKYFKTHISFFFLYLPICTMISADSDSPCICHTLRGAISLVLSTRCFRSSLSSSFSSGCRVLRVTNNKTNMSRLGSVFRNKMEDTSLWWASHRTVTHCNVKLLLLRKADVTASRT